MLKRIAVIVVGFGCIAGLHAQKQMQKSWDASAFETIFIESDAVYAIHIVSENRSTVTVSTSVQGEASETVLVTASEENRTLRLATARTPFFIPENDKLAAHKVMAIEMEIRVPEGMNFSVKSSLASVTLSGTFRTIQLALEEGNCLATAFKGNATIKTNKGFIRMETDAACTGIAVSKYNSVTNSLPGLGDYKIHATSIYGTVSLSQTK